MFLIRTGGRPIDADARISEGGERENKRKYSKERARGGRKKFHDFLLSFSID